MLIDNGTFAWVLREHRPVIVSSKDYRKRLLLRVMSTKSRTRGMFVGVLAQNEKDISHISLSLLSIVMMNGANALESFELYRMIKEINANLEKTVQERTKQLTYREEDLRKAHEELERRVEKRTAELKVRTGELEEVNSALRVLLKQREEDKRELEESVLSNVKTLIAPYVERLKKSRLDERQKGCVSVLESNIGSIIEPFSHRLSSKYFSLTPAEIQIADLIRQGETTKEIAEFLNLSSKTIESHRKNIRRKMRLKDKKVNLRTYLLGNE